MQAVHKQDTRDNSDQHIQFLPRILVGWWSIHGAPADRPVES